MGDSLKGAVISAAVAFITTGNPYAAAFAFAATLVSGMLADKPEAPNLPPFQARASTRTTTIRESITPRRVQFGVGTLSGPMTFYEATDSNRYHHLIITLCEGPIEGFVGYWVEGTPIPLEDIDGDGEVTAGRYAGKLRLIGHTGEASQTVDADLLSETSVTSAFRGRGVAYIYARVDWDQDTFPQGLPNISATIKGKKIYDPRTSTTVFADAAALVIRDFLVSDSGDGYGLGLATSRLDDVYFQSEASVCEEYVTTLDNVVTLTGVDIATDELEMTEDVAPWYYGDRGQFTTLDTLPAGLSLGTDYYIEFTREGPDTQKFKVATSRANLIAGTYVDITDVGVSSVTFTKDAEPRYAVSGLLETDGDPQKILNELRRAMAGQVIITGGVWRPQAGRYITPTLTFDEDDLRGPIALETRISRRSRYNAVKGVYLTHVNSTKPADYPPVTDATWEAADGKRIWHELDMPYTPRPGTAQRIAKIDLGKVRREQTFETMVSLKGVQLRAGDTVMFTVDYLSYSSKVWQVVSWRFAIADDAVGGKIMVCALTLREHDSNIFTWAAATDETTPAPAARSNIPDPWTAAAPTTFAVTTDSFLSDGGETVSRIAASWVAPADYLITTNGTIEVQFKRSTSGTWEPSFSVPGSELTAFVPGVENDKNYDIRIRSVNHLGVRSSWQTITNFKIGALSGGANSQRNYGSVTESVDAYAVRGAVPASVDKELDYEGVT